MSFGNRLKQLRLENNMTQEDLSKDLNVSRATVGRYETNERFPDKNILKNIADIFDVSIDYLLGRTNIRDTNFILKEAAYEKYLKNNICKEIENEVMERLLLEGIINAKENIPKEVIENIVKYGIDAAIKIAKLENEIKQNHNKE
ncbi:helix-turn-helix domain-containing protein [Tissierella sp. MSJ-40]|uniref:Helix-turn-helix domain-containing protein n=1 Tax=Tissierella simiarum TaxID=2841534 RepID=A0ABS6E1Q4_9FIRM|nr:helix-turn-helix transcriptional regulator [Tissierella simiarum]MBU5436833.1 helix-turn-helix domain-containing protein [Tissierella simiarum]